MPVPNQFPALDPPGARIAIVGQSPGQTEIEQGRPFCGPSGQFLDALLSSVGIPRSQCFVGNVCQELPPAGVFDNLDWNGPEVQAGIAQLYADLITFKPTIIFCLGNEALHLFKQGNVAPPRKGRRNVWPNSISSWRGTMFVPHDMHAFKALATYHPAAVLREWSFSPYVKFDARRLAEQSKTPGLRLPERDIQVISSDASAAIAYLRVFQARKEPISFDIEGYVGNMTCFALSSDPRHALVVPLARQDGSSVWSEAAEIAILAALQDLLEDVTVPKVLQNGLYDAFVLAWTYGILIRNQTDDTLLQWWEMYAELEKALDVQASILTLEPYWKQQRHSESDDVAWRYCGIDAAVTLECNQRLHELLTDAQRSHYQFNVSLLPACLYMEIRGMRFDREAAKRERKAALREVFALQAKIDREAGVVLSANEETFALKCLEQLGVARPRERRDVVEERWQPMRFNGKKWVKDGKLISSLPEGWQRLLVGDDEGSHTSESGFKAVPRTVSKLVDITPTTLRGCDPFILGSKRKEWRRVKAIWRVMCRLGRRYETKRTAHAGADQSDQTTVDGQYEKAQADRDSERSDTDTGRSLERDGSFSPSEALLGELATVLGLATNVGSTQAEGDAQRFLYDICALPKQTKRVKGSKTEKVSTDQNALVALYAKTQDTRVLWVLQLRRLRKLAGDLATSIDSDGRLRSTFSLVKETGRMSASKSPTGNGMNAQALNKDLRHLVLADEGCLMRQRDLEGADSWTVAAHAAALGDPTMLEDLRGGMKPAKVLQLLYKHGTVVNTWTLAEIKAKLKEDAPKFESWLYPACKAGTHLSSYAGGIPTFIQTVLRNSLSDLPVRLEEAKPLVLRHEHGKNLQAAFYSRYKGVLRWHDAWKARLIKDGVLLTSVGHIRRFYGRKKEKKQGQWVANHDTLKEALASEPQFWTTYATKRALAALWFDEANRREDGTLRVEPLFVVHDSLLYQHRDEDGAFCDERELLWFGNVIEIAGQQIVIPSEAQRGRDWSMKSL